MRFLNKIVFIFRMLHSFKYCSLVQIFLSSCLNFCDEVWWFLLFFGLLSSCLLLFPQRFGWLWRTELYSVMTNGIRKGDSREFNKECSSKFREGYQVRQTPEDDQRKYRPKRCGNNTKDEHNSPYTLGDKKKIILSTSNDLFRGARGVIVIVVGNSHGDTSSNPGRDWLHFT